MEILAGVLANEQVVQALIAGMGAFLGWLIKRMTYTISEEEKVFITESVVYGILNQANSLRNDADGKLSDVDKKRLFDQAARLVNEKVRAKTPFYVRWFWKKSMTTAMLETVIEGCVKRFKQDKSLLIKHSQ